MIRGRQGHPVHAIECADHGPTLAETIHRLSPAVRDTSSPAAVRTAHTVNQKMTKLRSLSAVLAVLLSAFASASLLAQEAANSQPSDSAAAASRQGIIVETVTDINDSPVPRAS